MAGRYYRLHLGPPCVRCWNLAELPVKPKKKPSGGLTTVEYRCISIYWQVENPTDDPHRAGRVIEHDEKGFPDTPEWCPFKEKVSWKKLWQNLPQGNPKKGE